MCTVVCWLEGAGGEATAAVGDWEATRCCVGVGGVCSIGDWCGVAAVAGWALGWSRDDGCSVASDSPLLCFDDVGRGATGCCDNLARSFHVPDPDWFTWLEWRKFSCSVSLVEVETLFLFVGHLFCFNGIMIRCRGFQGLGKNGNSGFELPSHEKFAWGKAVLKRGSLVHEEGKVGILVLLQ